MKNRIEKPALVTGLLMILAAIILGLLIEKSFITNEDLDIHGDFVERRTIPVNEFMKTVTAFFSPLGTLILAALCGLLVWLITRRKRAVGFLIGSVAIASAITHVLKLVFHRQRPPLIEQLVSETDFSFPSGHATGTAALMFALAFVLSTTRIPAWAKIASWFAAVFLTTLIVGSRLYLGVHWLTDTIAGCLIGVGTPLCLLRIIPDSEERLLFESED